MYVHPLILLVISFFAGIGICDCIKPFFKKKRKFRSGGTIKISYPNHSIKGALAEMQRLNRKPGFNLKRAYKCKSCKRWHLTSGDMVLE